MKHIKSILAILLVFVIPISDSIAQFSDSRPKTIIGINATNRVVDQYIIVYNIENIAKIAERNNRNYNTENSSLNMKSLAAGFTNNLVNDTQSELLLEYSSFIYGATVKNSNIGLIESYLNDSRVKNIYADILSEDILSTVQTDPTWALDRIDQEDLPLNSTYVYDNDGTGIHVYIMDTGINSDHEDFGGRVDVQNSFSPELDTIEDNFDGHGTHVTGILAGSKFGVAKNAHIHAIKVVNLDGGQASVVLGGYDWLLNNYQTPAVLNISLNFSAFNNDLDDENSLLGPLLIQANNALLNENITIVAAAGNDAINGCLPPSSYNGVIAVGAVDRFDTKADFSNFGQCLDIFAPGDEVLSSHIPTSSSVASISGTSMASPFVAGAAALYLQENPDATPAEVKDAIVNSASIGNVIAAGAGSVNKLLNVTALFNTDPEIVIPDVYDDVSIRGFSDDYEGDAAIIFKNTPQIHNFHDLGDEDWTMVWVGVNAVFEFKTDTIGTNSETNFEVYKVTDIVVNPNYPNSNRFIINNMQLVATGSNSSPKIISADGGFLYVMKVTSSNGSIGIDTQHRVSHNTVPIAHDQYDNVSVRGFTDDYEGDGEPIASDTPQVHNFHDSGDKDWTMVWVPYALTFNFEVNMTGHASDTKVSIYKVTDVIVNPNDPNANRFIINDKELVASDASSGNKNLTVNADGGFLYVMKVESRNNISGYGTEYEVNIY